MNAITFFTYAGGTAVFLIALISGEVLFSLGYEKRNNFIIRFFISNSVVFVISILLTLAYYYIECVFDSQLISGLRVITTYVIMFALAVAAMKFSYKESVLRYLSAGSAGYICQHISYNLYSIINESTNFEYSVISALGISAYLICLLVQLGCAAVVLTVCYFVFARKVNKLSADSAVRSNVFFIVICSLGIVLILSSISFIFSQESLSVSIILKCMLIVCCVFLLIIYLNIFETKEVKNELDIVMKLNQNEHAHYLKLKEDMEIINIKCHDIKHFIQIADKRKSIDTSELNEIVKIYDETIKTGNEIIDTLLAERNLYCSAHNINLTVIADASGLDYINATDMCSLFGNMLENAIEAVDKVTDESRRTIDVNIRPVVGQVFFCVENSYEEQPAIRNGLPVSSKRDDKYHGFGIKSIQLIAEKYGGSFSFSAENGIFRVNILFPIKEKN